MDALFHFLFGDGTYEPTPTTQEQQDNINARIEYLEGLEDQSIPLNKAQQKELDNHRSYLNSLNEDE